MSSARPRPGTPGLARRRPGTNLLDSDSDDGGSKASLWNTETVVTTQHADGTVTTKYGPVEKRAQRRRKWLDGLDAAGAAAAPQSEQDEHAINTQFCRRFFRIMRAGWDTSCWALLAVIMAITCGVQFVQTHLFNELISNLSTSTILYLYTDAYLKTPLSQEKPDGIDVGSLFPAGWNASVCDLARNNPVKSVDVCGRITDVMEHNCWGHGAASHVCLGTLLGKGCEKVDGQLSFEMGTGWWVFIWVIVWFLGMAACLSLGEFLSCRLRLNISSLLNRETLGKRRLYRLVALETGMDNYDQRVTEDLEYLLQMGVGILVGNYRNFLPVQNLFWALFWQTYYSTKGLIDTTDSHTIGVFYAVTLGMLLLMYLTYSYSMNRISRIQFNQKWYEGDMRWVHSRNVAHCESICLYNGEGRMEVRSDAAFVSVFHNYVRLSAYASFLWGCTDFFGSISNPFMLTFLHITSVKMAKVLSMASYVGGIPLAFATLMASWSQISLSGGPCHRIGILLERLGTFELDGGAEVFASARGRASAAPDGASVRLDGVAVRAPGARRDLFRDLSLALRPGERMCVMGATGSGKSAVLRVVAGLWPPQAGEVARPAVSGRGGAFFLPQRPYAFAGTLREQVVYPHRHTEGQAEAEEVERALHRAELGDLAARWGIDTAVAWPDVLSGGEMQRLSFARLLYQRPRLAVIDQGTSALDTGLEAKMFGLLAEEKVTVLSVIDRRSAIGHHSTVLRLSDGGEWRVEPVSAAHKEEAKEEERLAAQVGLVADDEPARPPKPAVPDEGLTLLFWRRLAFMLRLTFTSWTGPAALHLYAALLFSGLRGGLTIVQSKWTGDCLTGLLFSDGGALSLSDEWFVKVANLYISCVACMICTGSYTFCGMRLSMYFRAAVTNELHAGYFRPKVMYAVNVMDAGIDTVDQRLVQDMAAGTGLVDQLQTFLFAGTAGSGGVPGALTGFPRFAVMIIYAYTLAWFPSTCIIVAFFVGVGVMGFAASPLARAALRLARAEGLYRSAVAGVRQAAESIAFYHGETAEELRVGSLMRDGVYRRKVLVVLFGLPLVLTTCAVGIVTNVIPALLNSYAAFYIPSGAADAAGYTTALSFFLNFGLFNFAYLGGVMQSVGPLAGLTNRVGQLFDACERQRHYDDELREHLRDTDSAVAAENLSLATPDGARRLFDGLSFHVAPGRSMIVMGRSGCGKSSLLRVLGGLWKPSGHTGLVRRPGVVGTGGYLFLPQRTFTTEGTLAEQVIFPAVVRPAAVPEETVRELLEFVGLRGVIAKYGVHSPQPWDSTLSLGELQRLGFARVFFHRPKFVIMDEATSSIDLDAEGALMRRVLEMDITCITVAHRPSMIQYHRQLLRFDGEGGFKVTDILNPGALGPHAPAP